MLDSLYVRRCNGIQINIQIILRMSEVVNDPIGMLIFIK